MSLSPTIIVTPSATLMPPPAGGPTPSVIPVPTQIITPVPTPLPLPSGQTVTVTATELGYVRIRDGPTVDNVEIGQIPSGTTVAYSDVQYGWYKIDYNGIVGWISGTYVSVN